MTLALITSIPEWIFSPVDWDWRHQFHLVNVRGHPKRHLLRSQLCPVRLLDFVQREQLNVGLLRLLLGSLCKSVASYDDYFINGYASHGHVFTNDLLNYT